MQNSELIERAAALVPIVHDRAQDADEMRRLPDQSIQDLRDAGMFRILQPARFGGLEAGFGAFHRVVAELARGCASTAWVAAAFGIQSWYVGLLAEQAQIDVFGENPNALVASSFEVGGRAQPVEGGYRLSGRWRYASGCNHADWLALGGLTADAAEESTLRNFLVRRDDVEIVDTWHVLGLRGTGSNDVATEEVFVPLHRTVVFSDLLEGRSPGRQVNRSALYALPFGPPFNLALSSTAIGVARMTIEMFSQRLPSRSLPFGGGSQVEHSPTHVRLARAMAATDAAALVAQRDHDELDAGRAPAQWSRARMRLDAAYVVSLCVEAVDLLFAASGGGALHDSVPLQRAYRDVHAIAAHGLHAIDQAAEVYGRVVLGRDPGTVLL